MLKPFENVFVDYIRRFQYVKHFFRNLDCSNITIKIYMKELITFVKFSLFPF